MVGKKNHVRLSASYRYYRATYQTIVWVYGYCVLLAQACDRLRTTRLRANNLLPNSKEQTRETDIWKIVHCAISATNYLLFGLIPQLSKITVRGLEVNTGISEWFSEYAVSRDGKEFTEHREHTEHWTLRGQEKILYFIYVTFKKPILH